MRFKLIECKNEIDKGDDTAIYLEYIHFDDYGYCTEFYLYIYHNSSVIELGLVKIGCVSLRDKVKQGRSAGGYNSYSIKELIPEGFFDELDEEFFSLGVGVAYYRELYKVFNKAELGKYLSAVKDLAYNFARFNELYHSKEPSLINSLLRSLHNTNVEQFGRIIKGEAELTPYDIRFSYQKNDYEINVMPGSLPPTNVHVLIGRNGVGKTWLLYHMLYNVLKNIGVSLKDNKSSKYTLNKEFELLSDPEAFAGAIGISFSLFDDAFSAIAFDSILQEELYDSETQEYKRLRNDFDKKYKYIGLVSKNQKNGKLKTKSLDDLCGEFIDVLSIIAKDDYKADSYREMCMHLEADPMFSDNGFHSLLLEFVSSEREIESLRKGFRRLSSGHMIIMLSLTMLCNSIFERTIVLIDEPETHLHPPLLSTYVRALSSLLRQKNAVAVIATHSPIVLQEVPKSCVMEIKRIQTDMTFSRPQSETFATSTDSITRDIFGYEIGKTGFHKLIQREALGDFNSTMEKFEGQVGFLGQMHIQRLVNSGSDEYAKD